MKHIIQENNLLKKRVRILTKKVYSLHEACSLLIEWEIEKEKRMKKPDNKRFFDSEMLEIIIVKVNNEKVDKIHLSPLSRSNLSRHITGRGVFNMPFYFLSVPVVIDNSLLDNQVRFDVSKNIKHDS